MFNRLRGSRAVLRTNFIYVSRQHGLHRLARYVSRRISDNSVALTCVCWNGRQAIDVRGRNASFDFLDEHSNGGFVSKIPRTAWAKNANSSYRLRMDQLSHDFFCASAMI